MNFAKTQHPKWFTYLYNEKTFTKQSIDFTQQRKTFFRSKLNCKLLTEIINSQINRFLFYLQILHIVTVSGSILYASVDLHCQQWSSLFNWKAKSELFSSTCSCVCVCSATSSLQTLHKSMSVSHSIMTVLLI